MYSLITKQFFPHFLVCPSCALLCILSVGQLLWQSFGERNIVYSPLSTWLPENVPSSIMSPAQLLTQVDFVIHLSLRAMGRSLFATTLWKFSTQHHPQLCRTTMTYLHLLIVVIWLLV